MIFKVKKIFLRFFESQQSGGIVLVICTLMSLLFANSAYSSSYLELWDIPILGHHLIHWINDGLMAVFFFLIGLELKREILVGEPSDFKNALLPIIGAVGGMIVPALIYSLLNYNTSTISGFGIPMATDIAFAVGILSLLGSSVPLSLKVFLTALAVIDDLGAILVIAVFYSSTIYWGYLLAALGIFVLLMILNRLQIKTIIIYLAGGVMMWYCMLHSGIHATIAGVLLAITIPFDKDDSKSPSYQIQNFLHLPVAFLVLPIFAFANTAIVITTGWTKSFTEPFGLGILSGLIIGKPLGIFMFCLVSVRMGICRFPTGITKKSLSGVGFLAGIGFTMSIFISLLAFDEEILINESKMMILCASLIAGIIGYIWLRIVLK